MPHFWSESSASENEDLTRDLKRQKNLTNEDGIVQQNTSYHNKLVDSCCDLEIKSDKDTGALVPSNAPSDLYPSTSICSFCQSSKISEVIYDMHQFYALNQCLLSPPFLESLFSYLTLIYLILFPWFSWGFFVGYWVNAALCKWDFSYGRGCNGTKCCACA